jgi:hypothetical protein
MANPDSMEFGAFVAAVSAQLAALLGVQPTQVGIAIHPVPLPLKLQHCVNQRSTPACSTKRLFQEEGSAGSRTNGVRR